MGRLMFWAAAVVVLGAYPCDALAGDADDANKADESFHAGRALLKDKRYADACPKFEESQRQDPASGTLLALAYCQELSGLLATSWTNYLAAAQLAEREGQADRQSAATEKARALSTRVSKLTVIVPGELLSMPGFHLQRDGIEFERASIGVPIPTDGGTHAFVASAPGRVAWSSTVTLFAEHDQKTLVLPVLDLTTPVAGAQVGPAPPLVSDSASVSDNDSARTFKLASLGLAAAAVVGVGVGAGFAISANSKNNASNADGHCTGGCDARGSELRNSALNAARVSTWSFVTSGALAACSLTLYLTASGKASGPKSATKVLANVSLGAPSLFLSRSF